MASSKLTTLSVAFSVTGLALAAAGCNAPPRMPDCGDGFLDVAYGEECDDGNDTIADGCSLFCAVEASWECTDATPLDGTPGTCVELRCGDGRVTDGEACDESSTATATCDVDCTLVECGDGTLNTVAGEECDDDNVMPGDGCTPDCVREPATCGNGVCDLAGEETCSNCMRDCTMEPSCTGCADLDMDGYYDVACGGNDCDDTMMAVHPDAMDILCNDIDDDCSMATSGTVDADMDGWRCGLDCDDMNAMASPSLDEVCGNGIDDDCDPTTVDTGDGDGDTYNCDVDCDDTNPMIHPGGREVCNNGVNDDCDLATADVADLDGDGFFCNSASECDDYEETVHAGAPEIACDGLDNDCLATTPDRPDLDMDGASCEMDCNDMNARVSALRTEVCGDMLDNDCSATTPDSADRDGDTFDCAVDCNDMDRLIFPDSVGRCGMRFRYAEDFSDDASGWTVSGTTTSWAYGTPSGAAKGFITGCAGGTMGCWVTGLTTDYGNNEMGYVTSPAFNMSGVTVDPTLSFSHIFETQASADSSWMEISLDGGVMWTRLGLVGEGTAWYNNNTPGAYRNTWDGTSGAAGAWRTASHVLTGAAGHADVRVRFAFQSNAATVRDGVAFDDIVIDNQRIDVAVSDVSINRTACGATGSVAVTVANLGQVTLPSYSVSLIVEGRAPVVQNLMTPLLVGATAVVTFPSIAFTMDPTAASATVTAGGDDSATNNTLMVSRGCIGISAIPFAPVATTGTALPASDDGVTTVPIGFSFRFFENTYTTVTIGTNGLVMFTGTASGCCSGGTIPATGTPNNLIAAGWTDLATTRGGTITYELRGTTPGSRTFVISYNNVSWLTGTGAITSQIILSESGRIQIHTTSQSAGHVYTQGVENLAGTVAYFLPGRVAADFALTNDAVEIQTF